MAEYGLFARRDLKFGGVPIRRGERVPDEMEIRDPRRIQRCVESGAIRRRPLTSAEVAQAMGDPDTPQVDIQSVVSEALTSRQ